MKIKFRFNWYDDAQTIMQFVALEDWTWKDYHAAWQPLIFKLIAHEGPVHILFDFREQTRSSMPRGASAHLNSFGTKLSPKLSGLGVVVGYPDADIEQLPLDKHTFETKSGTLYFAEDATHADELLANLATES